MLAQNYPNLGYIIEDGGSTDGTVQLLESYGDRIVWRSERDTGQANAINRGFARVHGEIMAYLNSDDVLLPGALAYVAQIFLAKPAVDIVYGHRIFIDREARKSADGCCRPIATRPSNGRTTQETMFWRRQVWDKVGPLDESFQYALDWDFALRARAAGFRFLRLPRSPRLFSRPRRTEIDCDEGYWRQGAAPAAADSTSGMILITRRSTARSAGICGATFYSTGSSGGACSNTDVAACRSATKGTTGPPKTDVHGSIMESQQLLGGS